VQNDRFPISVCNLCGQPQSETAVPTTISERIEFERAQLQEESGETERLIQNAVKELARITDELEKAIIVHRELTAALAPARQAAVSSVGPDLTVIEREIGQLEERIKQLERLKNVIARKTTAAQRIDELNSEIAKLRSELEGLENSVPFAELSDAFTERLNTYLNALNEGNQRRWEAGKLTASLTADKFRLTINGRPWQTQLGGTNVALGLFAYHYALLGLTNQPEHNYPGFMVLDLPPKLSEVLGVQDDENYLLIPFLELLSRAPFNETQVIVAGQAFEGLPAATRNVLPRRT
jgi:hypothetical protein